MKVGKIRPIYVGPGAEVITVNSNTGTIYVANSHSKTVYVISGSDNKVANLTVGKHPCTIATDPKLDTVYVSYFGDRVFDKRGVFDKNGTLYVLRGSDNKVMANLTVGKGPCTIATDSKLDTVYVLNYDSNTVSIINSTKNQIVTTVPIPTGPGHLTAMAVDEETHKVYISKSDPLFGSSLIVIDGKNLNRMHYGNGTHDRIIWGHDTHLGTLPAHTKDNYDSYHLFLLLPELRVGANPTAIAIDSITNKIYVVNSDSNTISLIDSNTDNILRELRVGLHPAAIAVNPKTHMVYVVNNDGNRISVINGNTNNIISTFVSGNSSFPRGIIPTIAVNPTKNIVYVTNHDSNTVSIINGSDNKVISSLPVGYHPTAISINLKTNMAYVLNSDSGTVSVINGSTNNKSSSSAGIQYNQPGPAVPGIMLDKSPVAIAFNPITNRLYVAEMEFLGNSVKNYTIAVIDVSGRILKNIPIPNNSSISFGNSFYIPIGLSPNSIAVSPLSNLIYVSNANTGYVYVIDGRDNSFVKTLDLGGYPDALAVDYRFAPYDQTYVVKQFSPAISVILGTDFEKMTVPLHTNASAIAFDPNTDKIFVASSESNKVSMLDGNGPTLLKDIALDSSPSSIAVNPNIDMVYLANSGDNTVSVIDPYNDTKLASISVGNSPSAIAVDPKTDKIFVANSDSNTVSVIDGKHYTVIDNILVGEKPSSIAVNSNMSLIYVANSQSNTISVINEKTNNVMVEGTFNINPSNSGRIRCNGVEIATNDYVRLDVDTKCEAQAHNGYQFVSWSEQLGHNSSKTITASSISDSLFSSLLSYLGFKSNDNSTFKASSYGHFIANFRAVPPPIPPEYSLALIGVVLSSVLGWFVPNIASWANARRKRKSLREYIDKNKDEPELGKLYHPKIMKEITDLYTKGKISEEQYKILKDMISDNLPDANKP